MIRTIPAAVALLPAVPTEHSVSDIHTGWYR